MDKQLPNKGRPPVLSTHCVARYGRMFPAATKVFLGSGLRRKDERKRWNDE